jgi:curli biogenesis system outer membrane secretion channel CsgG
MRLRKLYLFPLLVFLFAFWSCATMSGTGGSQTQGTQVAQAQPAPQPAPPPVAPARQVTHKGPKLRVGIVDFVNKSSYGAGRLGTSASDILTTELFKKGAFSLSRSSENKPWAKPGW